MKKFLTGKFTGIPVFILVMLTVFHLTFNVAGKFLSDKLSLIIDMAVNAISYRLISIGAGSAFHALIIDGVCTGIGSVLSFIPIIAVLFFLLSLLEGIGYLPNVAALMDRPMMKIGLSGKCVVPLIMGFGCAVPAVIAAGSMLPPGQRDATITIIPFMSCSAKLPIYAIFTSVFFEDHRVLVMSGIYITGIAVALLYAAVTNSGKNHISFTCNTPPRPYGIPDMKQILTIVWINVKGFIKKAFTVIFMASVIIWFLQSFDSSMHMVSDSSESLLASAGKFTEPVFAPLGFGDWRAAAAVIAGLSAKEAVVSTFAVLSCTVGDGSMSAMLTQLFSPLSAFSFMVFCLLYIPCIATLATVRNQTGGWRLSIKMVLIQVLSAWITSFLIYHFGALFI